MAIGFWSGFSRRQSVQFHPSMKISTFECKNGQPFNLFTKCLGKQALKGGNKILASRNDAQQPGCKFQHAAALAQHVGISNPLLLFRFLLFSLSMRE
jgi:hypothetical protein